MLKSKPEDHFAKEFALDCLFDFVGSAVFSVGIHSFTAPALIAPGGVSGIATILNYFFHIPIGTVSLLINVPLLLLAWKFLGMGFVAKTLKSLLIMTVTLDVLFANFPIYEGDFLLAALFGGIFIGAGLGIIFMRGSTTGGTDILTKLLLLKFPYMPMGQLMMLINFSVLVASAIAFHDIEKALYGLIAIFASSKMVDMILYGGEQGKMAVIVSGKSQEIAEGIIGSMSRGVTMLKSAGAYTNREGQVALCAVRKSEFYKVKKVVQQIDPQAFIIVCDTSQVIGAGFKSIQED